MTATNMVVGYSIFKMDGTPFFRPEFQRGGLAATFSLDVSHLSGSPTVTVSVEHRNADETAFSPLGQFDAITGTGPASKDLTGIREIVRFKYEFDGADDATDGMHFQIQVPGWRPY